MTSSMTPYTCSRRDFHVRAARFVARRTTVGAWRSSSSAVTRSLTWSCFTPRYIRRPTSYFPCATCSGSAEVVRSSQSALPIDSERWKPSPLMDPPRLILQELCPREEVRDLRAGGLGRIGAVDRVVRDVLREELAQGPRRRLGRVRGAHDVAVLGNGVLALEDHENARPARHELRQLAEEGPGLVDRVEAFRFAERQVDLLHRADAEAFLLEP